MARAAYEASRMRRPDEPWGAAGDEEPRTRTGVGYNHRAGGPQENPTERSVGETWGRKVRNRRPRGRSKSSASLVDGRRLGPGKATPCHDGGVEAVLAALAESVKKQRATAKRARTGIERRSRQGCQRYGRAGSGFGRELPHHSCAVRRSDAERRETLSSPVSMGGNPARTRPTKSRCR